LLEVVTQQLEVAIANAKQADLARESERRLAEAQRIAHLGHWVWNTRTGRVWWSDEVYNIFGIEKSDFDNTYEGFLERVHPDDRKTVETSVAEALGGDSPYAVDHRIVLPDGTVRIVHERAVLKRDERTGAAVMVGTVQDVTEQKRTEEVIREQAALLDKARDAICVVDLEGDIIYWNPGSERVYGWTAEEAVGRNVAELLAPDDEEDTTGEIIKAAQKEGEWTGELVQVTKDGRRVTVESRWSLVTDERGRPKSILVINTDITERKELEAQLLRTQRLESLGTLATGIAHDLNNVFQPILLALQLLRARSHDRRTEEIIDTLQASVKRGSDLVKQVLAFGRGATYKNTALDLRGVIEELTNILRETLPRSIEIVSNIDEGLWTVNGDHTQLYQVLMNLCLNARDAMAEGGTLKLVAENTVVDRHQAASAGLAEGGRFVVVTVSDTGHGIRRELVDKIFDPFFTTKEPGKGSGLGLSTSYRIVKDHGGFITVDTEEGAGTTFKVYLPATTSGDESEPGDECKPMAGRGELIMVVDDEASVREVTKMVLEDNGYRVMVTEDGVKAVVLFAEHHDKVDAVVLDMMMPLMEGRSTIKALRELDPAVKIVVATGVKNYVEADTLEVEAVLVKPYSTHTLLKTLSDILNPTP